MVVRRPAPKRADSEFKRFLETKKVDRVVLGPIERHLLAQRDLDPYEGRPQDIIHPSELVSPEWCQRAEYYKLTGAEKLKKERPIHFNLETVFGEGHLIHSKYQNWLWDCGLLQGNFRCQYCGFKWWAESPEACTRPGCVAGRECLVYAEVPVWSEEYRIGGHADGELVGGREGLEVKSIGIGTLRVEHPELLGIHTHEFPDGSKQPALDDLWRSINRPFPKHLKQGILYGVIREWERVIFVYECKWNQKTKEFIVKVNPELVQDLLDSCKDVLYAIEKGKPPPCTNTTNRTCSCSAYEPGEPDGSEKDPQAGGTRSSREANDIPKRVPSPGGLDRRGRNGSTSSQGRTRQEGDGSRTPARVRRTIAPGRVDRSR